MYVLVCQSQGEVIFSDNFESGNLSLWTVDGRQQGLANVADVVDKYDSKMGHLYHQGFSEITIEKSFDFDENLTFSFDFEANVTAGGGYPDYASGGAEFDFRDSGQNLLGRVSYTKATSSYVFDLENPRPDFEHFRIPNEAGLVSYASGVQDLLSYITIDEDLISSVRLRFTAYCSGSTSAYTSNVWVDNIVVTPEPVTIALLAIGAVAVFRKK
jgi:hypothetical protein